MKSQPFRMSLAALVVALAASIAWAQADKPVVVPGTVPAGGPAKPVEPVKPAEPAAPAVPAAPAAPAQPATAAPAQPAAPASPAPAADAKKDEGKKEDKQEPPAPKPQTRTVRAAGKGWEVILKVKPGIPDPGKVALVDVQASRLVNPPDPFYGPRVPVTSRLVATPAHENFKGDARRYEVRPSGDAGNYAFHFTPPREGWFKIRFQSTFRNEEMDITARIPVGMWPLPKDDSVEIEGGKKKKEEAPVMPAGRGPVVPQGFKAGVSTASPASAGAGDEDAVHEAMEEIGEAWAGLSGQVFAAASPVQSRSEADADNLLKVIRELKAKGPMPMGSAADAMMAEMETRAAELQGFVKAKKYKEVRDVMNAMSAGLCLRCHLVYHMDVMQSADNYPASLGTLK
ncbi:MAG: hypothetical protein GMKNLPBB_01949 [Myxococcota bacterium]|nr:hypothetical protein [Myxococcota bacterium]